jgi:hypothetical protein
MVENDVKAMKENELMEVHVVVVVADAVVVDGFEYVMNLLKKLLMILLPNEMFVFQY